MQTHDRADTATGVDTYLLEGEWKGFEKILEEVGLTNPQTETEFAEAA